MTVITLMGGACWLVDEKYVLREMNFYDIFLCRPGPGVASCSVWSESTLMLLTDAPNFWVVFCRQSHLGCTDMSLQQNRDKMPKFASLSNYTYQISYTLNACVKYMFCILCIVVTMSL